MTNKKLVIMLFSFFILVSAGAQNKYTISIDTVYQIDSNFKFNDKTVKIGGISGIEFIQDVGLLMVTDASKDKTKSLLLFANDSGRINSLSQIMSTYGAESIRYNSKRQLFISFETDDSTWIGSVEKNSTIKSIFSLKMLDSFTPKNRGIEAIAFDKNDDLWCVLETGGTSCKSGITPFFKFVPDVDGNYMLSKKYNYPINRCSCFNGIKGRESDFFKGNGISDMLAFPDKSLKFLMLERCFSGSSTIVELKIAEVAGDDLNIKKDSIFRFYTPSNSKLSPKNIEGMTWGPVVNGIQKIFVVADNNYGDIKCGNLFYILSMKIEK